jgi:hypothetical protein
VLTTFALDLDHVCLDLEFRLGSAAGAASGADRNWRRWERSTGPKFAEGKAPVVERTIPQID